MSCWRCMQCVLPRQLFPEEATSEWANLSEWNVRKLHHDLPTISDGESMHVVILSATRLTVMIVTKAPMPDEVQMLGKFITPNSRTSSDPVEVARLLRLSRKGYLLSPLVDEFSRAPESRRKLAHEVMRSTRPHCINTLGPIMEVHGP